MEKQPVYLHESKGVVLLQTGTAAGHVSATWSSFTPLLLGLTWTDKGGVVASVRCSVMWNLCVKTAQGAQNKAKAAVSAPGLANARQCVYLVILLSCTFKSQQVQQVQLAETGRNWQKLCWVGTGRGLCDNYSAKKDVFTLIYLIFYIRVEQVIQVSRHANREPNKLFWVEAAHITSSDASLWRHRRSNGDI